jgi:hypothetical protein
MRKIIILIVVILAVVIGFNTLKSRNIIIFKDRCGDKICDAKEKANLKLCPKDCKSTSGGDTGGTGTSGGTSGGDNGNGTGSGDTGSGDTGTGDTGTGGDQPPQPPLTGSSASPFGFHPAKPYDSANDIGIKWTRGGDAPYVFWSFVDSGMTGDPTKFKWSGTTAKGGSFNYGSLINSQSYGINLLHNIDVEPSRSGYRKNGSYLPSNEQVYKNFVKEVVKRHPNVRYWQIGNEPSAGLSDYGEFMCLNYDAIKEADSGVKVLIGGAPGMNMPQSFSNYKTTFDSTFLPLLQDIAEENRKCFDVFDYHWYGDDDDYLMVKDIHNYIVGKISSLGIPAPEEYWITEMGTYSGDPVAKTGDGRVGNEWPYQSEKQQAIDLIKRYVYPLSLGVKKIFMAYGLREGFTNTGGYFDLTGLIYDGKSDYDQGSNVKKLSYYTYKKMTSVLEGSDWNNIQKVQESGGIYIYKFNKSGKSIWVAWNDNTGSKQITISGINSGSVKITEAVPNKELGKDVNYATDFITETKSASNGSVSITIGDKPVFVETQ